MSCRPGRNGEHLAALSSCPCIGWAAESRRVLRALKEGSDLGIAFCRLHPSRCPLRRTPWDVRLQAQKLRRGEWARGGGWAGRRVRGAFPAPLVEHEAVSLNLGSVLGSVRCKSPALCREARCERGAKEHPPACWEEQVLPPRHLNSLRW